MTEEPFDNLLDQFRSLLREAPPRDSRGQLVELMILTIMQLTDRRLTHVEAFQKQIEALKDESAELRQALRDLDQDFEAQEFALFRALDPDKYNPGPRAKKQRARQALHDIMSAERETAIKPPPPGCTDPKPR